MRAPTAPVSRTSISARGKSLAKGSTILLSVLIDAAWSSTFCMNGPGRRITHLMPLALSRSSMAAWPRPTTDSESALARGRLPPTRTRYWAPALSAASSTLFCCSAMLGLCPVTTNTL